MIFSGAECLPPVTPDEWWPVLQPAGYGAVAGEFADFSYDATADITIDGMVDPIVSMTICAKPSGAGEVSLSRLTLTDNIEDVASIVTVWLAPGVAGRVYLYQLVLTTTAGRVLPIFIGQVCNPLLAVIPIPVAPVPGFGATISYP